MLKSEVAANNNNNNNNLNYTSTTTNSNNSRIPMPGMNPDEITRREADIVENQNSIVYSKRYSDNDYEYRHVILPKAIAKWVPTRLMTEDEWRSLGVTQSPGWMHYMIHAPEPHILLFRRDKDADATNQ